MSEQTSSICELATFQQFLSEHLLQQGFTALTPEESVEEFRAYQRQLEQLRQELTPALEQHRRGEGGKVDINEIVERNRQRLAERGITE